MSPFPHDARKVTTPRPTKHLGRDDRCEVGVRALVAASPRSRAARPQWVTKLRPALPCKREHHNQGKSPTHRTADPDTVLIVIDDRVAVVTLNRPEALNAWNGALAGTSIPPSTGPAPPITWGCRDATPIAASSAAPTSVLSIEAEASVPMFSKGLRRDEVLQSSVLT